MNRILVGERRGKERFGENYTLEAMVMMIMKTNEPATSTASNIGAAEQNTEVGSASNVTLLQSYYQSNDDSSESITDNVPLSRLVSQL